MIGFAGLSHLGIVSSIAAAAKGFDTIAFDPQEGVVMGLSAGRLPIVEPGLDDLLAEHRGRLRWSSDPQILQQCRLIYVSVDVPIDGTGASDATPVVDLLDTIATHSAPDAVVIVLSQVRPGFTRRCRPLVERDGRRLFYQVETLIFGRAVERALRPERFMVGCVDPAAPLPAVLSQYLEAFGCPILPMRLESAELAKIAINMFLSSTLTTTNMLAGVCESIGADWSEIAPSLRLDARIGPHAYLTPGLGIGGTNLLRDMVTIRTIAAEHGADAGPIESWIVNNKWRREWALRALYREVLTRVPSPLVAVWGLAYKENTASTRNSPGVELVTALRGMQVRAYDPSATLGATQASGVTVTGAAIEACRDADVLMVMTAWPEFAAADPGAVAGAMRGKTIIDPFGVLSKGGFANQGFTYLRMGAATIDGVAC
jgi:UDPglucose 6-dehydrogenase